MCNKDIDVLVEYIVAKYDKTHILNKIKTNDIGFEYVLTEGHIEQTSDGDIFVFEDAEMNAKFANQTLNVVDTNSIDMSLEHLFLIVHYNDDWVLRTYYFADEEEKRLYDWLCIVYGFVEYCDIKGIIDIRMFFGETTEDMQND